ncbi:MAG: discoidin domain-containing protein [Candidatus Omnitrophota bacterium]|nr:discoidin domain-containing protein [Candidatus Omnitrophota bacterium]
MHNIRNEKGVILIFVLLILVALTGVALAFIYAINSEIRSAGAGLTGAKAFYVAEAGRSRARWALTTGTQSVGWTETSSPFGAGNGTYVVTTAYSDPPTNQHVTIISYGYIPDNTNIQAERLVKESNIPIASGTNLSLASNGTAATSSSYQGQNVPGQVIDGITNTGWVSSVKATSWLALNYGSSKTVGSVVVSGSKITSIVVQYSNDGTNWTAVSNPSGALPGTRTFTAVTARYLRLNITSDANEKAQVNEFESYSGSGGAPTLGPGKFATSL